jgi:hypothetical protein
MWVNFLQLIFDVHTITISKLSNVFDYVESINGDDHDGKNDNNSIILSQKKNNNIIRLWKKTYYIFFIFLRYFSKFQ